MNIKDFIKYWEEEAQQIAIQTSENIDAIRLMTIHASKGLEFPVVFLPMMNGNKDKKFDEWYDLEGFNELKSVNINKFDDKIASYDSDLQQFNDVNIYKNKIDRLCALYVATTRPKEQLFLYLQKGSKTGGNQLEILDFVTTKSASENPNEFDIYEEINHSYQKQTKKSEVAKPTQAIKNTTKATDNKNNIAIATPSKNYQNTQESVRIGILTHEILEQISTEKDIASAIGKYVLEGIITEDEKIKISERLLKVIRDEKYKAYFSDGLKVFNERDIMISENGISKIYRPDRLIETADGIIIIDFKTGAEREKYETQIATYQHALEQLGKKVAKTEIIYI
ncbi:MAG: 3'-5' exonuclease [Bergeyella zoohelcum]|nr:3'-5' exonuclease [Bergeyella zoohelcum]